MKNGILKENKFAKIINSVIIAGGVLAVGGTFTALASAIYVDCVDYKNIDQYKYQVSQTAEFEEYKNEKADEYYTAFLNGELDKEGLMAKLDEIDNVDNFLEERGTDKQIQELASLVKIKDRNLLPACVGIAVLGAGVFMALISHYIGIDKLHKMGPEEEDRLLGI